jgi:hypothetical protein
MGALRRGDPLPAKSIEERRTTPRHENMIGDSYDRTIEEQTRTATCQRPDAAAAILEEPFA